METHRHQEEMGAVLEVQGHSEEEVVVVQLQALVFLQRHQLQAAVELAAVAAALHRMRLKVLMEELAEEGEAALVLAESTRLEPGVMVEAGAALAVVGK